MNKQNGKVCDDCEKLKRYLHEEFSAYIQPWESHIELAIRMINDMSNGFRYKRNHEIKGEEV